MITTYWRKYIFLILILFVHTLRAQYVSISTTNNTATDLVNKLIGITTIVFRYQMLKYLDGILAEYTVTDTSILTVQISKLTTDITFHRKC
jgi:hypothetical protein